MARRQKLQQEGDETLASPEDLRRWMVNYIRHSLTEYDKMRRGMTDEQVRELRKQVLDEIAETYPMLRDECERQKKHHTKENNQIETAQSTWGTPYKKLADMRTCVPMA